MCKPKAVAGCAKRGVSQARRARSNCGRLRTFIEATLPVTDDKALFSLSRAYVGEYGANLLSYHIVIENLLRVRMEDGLHVRCFPPDWVARDLSKNYFDIDPIIAAAMTGREPFRWSDVAARGPLTPAQSADLDDMRAFGLVDGLAAPIFAARATTAYFGLGSNQAPLTLTHSDELEIQYARNYTHNVFVDIRAARALPSAALSNWEREVLG
jgi:hypothetical protein